MTPPAATAARPLRAPARRAPARHAPARPAPARPARVRRPPRNNLLEHSSRTFLGQSALVSRLGRALASVPEHRLLDRLVRGRFWIGFVAFALLGIVAMQLSLLKLNTGIGRALEHQSLLERQNATLRDEVSSLSAGDRVETQAARAGMVVAAPGSITFLKAGGSGVARRAAKAMMPPAATAVASGGTSGAASGASTGAASGASTGAASGTSSGAASGTPTRTTTGTPTGTVSGG